MSRYHGPERRRYYRLKYPLSLRPVAAIDGLPFVVTEISECGLRFHHVEHVYESDHELESIWVRFSDGELVEVGAARIVRRHGEETAVEFDHAVSFDRMVKEQMAVIRCSYPGKPPADEDRARAEAIVSEAQPAKKPSRPRTGSRARIRFAQLRRLHEVSNDS